MAEIVAETKQNPAKITTPYVGPKPFEPHEKTLFFGREWETEELKALIVAHPAVLLYAQSGAGKTSLLNARLLPDLRAEENYELLPAARVRGDLPDEVQLRQIENLYVFNTLMAWTEMNDEVTPEQLIEVTIAQFLRRLPRGGDEEGYPVLRLLIFDQFEELFTFYPERWPERDHFFRQINQALTADPYLRVLFVIREDYVAQLDAYADRLPEQLRPRFRLERLGKEAALAAVTGPLAQTDRSFAPGVAERLVDELLTIRVEGPAGQILERPGEFVEPVQLQVVCQSLWLQLPSEVTQITADHLETFGDVDQALVRFYERAVQDTVQRLERIQLYTEWRLRAWFEQEAITPADTRGLVYRGPDKTGSIPNPAVDILESHHLIRGERRAGARWYELTHDRFIGPIQKSNRAWRIDLLKRGSAFAAGVVVVLILVLVAAGPVLDVVGNPEATAVVVARTAVARASMAEATASAAEATATVSQEMSNQAEAAAAELVATSTAAAQAVRKERVRPLRAGLSIGGVDSTAGTLGYFVQDPAGRSYIFSAVDVLGPSPGTEVLQPGPFDGGQSPQDVIGEFARRLNRANRTIPAAVMVGLVQLQADVEIQGTVPDLGPVLGVRPAEPGMQVHKLGRSTGLTSGRITAIDQDIQIFLADDQVLQVQGAIRASLESAGGDGGALVINDEGYAIGVLVAGSAQETIVAPLQDVLDSFNVQLLPPSLQIEDLSATLATNPEQSFPTRPLARIERIVLHHTATGPITVQRLAQALASGENAFPGITYHYCVSAQGVVYQTQPWTVAASQLEQYSPESLSVCLIGDFSTDPPPQPQLNATAVLLADLVRELDLSVEQIEGASSLIATESPGASWSQWREPLLDKVRGLLAGDLRITVATPQPTPTPAPLPSAAPQGD